MILEYLNPRKRCWAGMYILIVESMSDEGPVMKDEGFGV